MTEKDEGDILLDGNVSQSILSWYFVFEYDTDVFDKKISKKMKDHCNKFGATQCDKSDGIQCDEILKTWRLK